MYANSERDPNEARLAGDGSVQMPALPGYAALIYSEVNQSETHLGGTIDTSLDESDRHYFAVPSEMLTRGLPVAAKAAAHVPARPQTRAKDLIAELNAINTQIHQIMFQVEKAVSRLATSG